ncbi:MAG: hypothetical protein IT245_06705 [Bacteroidia bacterium]|nr:hypothetical protein [Bacteroidia bacterium]
MLYGNKKPFKIGPTEAEKYANDMQLAKDMINSYAMINPDMERIDKHRQALEVHSGRWSKIEALETGIDVNIGGENFKIGSTKIRHYDKIGRITRGMLGAFMSAPLVAIFKDISSKSKSISDKLKLEGIKANLYEKYIAPKIDIITKQELLKVGATSMFDLSPEQQMQIQGQIAERTKQESPEEIISALEKIKTPDEQVCQLLFNYTANKEKIKSKYDQGAEFAICTGEEYYRPSIINGFPKLEVLIPEGVVFGGSRHVPEVENKTFATYTQGLSVEDVIARFGLGFLKDDVDNISKYYNVGYNNNTRPTNNYLYSTDRAAVEFIGSDPVLSQTNFLTRRGQDMLSALYSKIGSKIDAFSIQHKYVTFRWQTWMYQVTRLVNGKPKTFIVSGHYVRNPKTDIKIKRFLAPQVWQGDRLGEDSFHNLEVIPYQYDSIQDPFSPKLGIFGGMYNTVMGTTKNYSLVDNGLVWNFRYNQIMARLDEIESTNYGKIALLDLNSKPDGILWEDWVNGLLTAKIGIASKNKDFQGNNKDKDPINNIDLSRLVDAANTIQQLQYAESELYKNMYYSEAKTGDINQYTTNQNASLQIQGADLQLLGFYTRHREITTAVSQAMLKNSLIAYRDNEQIKDAVLDDFLKAHYEINMKNEDVGQYAIAILDTMNEMKSVQKMTDLALSFVQTGIIKLRELSRLFSATTMAEAQDIIDEAEAIREKEVAADRVSQQEMEAKNAQYQQDLLKLKQDFDALQKDLDRKVKITLADIGSHMMANASDIDGDKVNDSLTKAYAEIAATQQRHKDEMAFKYAELAVEKTKVTQKP